LTGWWQATPTSKRRKPRVLPKAQKKIEMQNAKVKAGKLSFSLLFPSGRLQWLLPRGVYFAALRLRKRGANQIPGALPLAMILCPFGAMHLDVAGY
jgi:hypothetical protein